MKNERGITLVSLVVTIILLFVLASITTSAGLESYRTMQVQTFCAKMKVIQSKVSIIKAEYKNWQPAPGQGTTLHDYCADVLGFTQVSAIPEDEQKAFGALISRISATNPTSWSQSDEVLNNYFYFDTEAINTKLGLKNVDGVSVIINFDTGNIIERHGVINPKKTNSRIYRQYDYSGGDQLIPGSTPDLAYVDDSQAIVDFTDDGGAGGITGESGVGINEQYTEEGLLVNETRIPAQGFMLRVFLTQNFGNMQRFKIALLGLDGNTTSVNIQNLKYMSDNSGRSVWVDAGDERVANINFSLNQVTFDVKVTDNYNFAIENSNYDLVTVNGKIDVTLVNPPKLAQGMVPVYWKAVEEGELVTNKRIELTGSDTTNPFWYNYAKDQKHWANAKTADGSYWVWIPRYSYLYDSNAESVDIKFLDGTTADPFDGQTNNYNIHPSFTYQNAIGTNNKIYPAGQWDSDLTGYWIAKYDAGKEVTTRISYQDDHSRPIYSGYGWNRRIIGYEQMEVVTTTETLKCVPGVACSDKNTYEEAANICSEFRKDIAENYSNLNTHLMRNSEWGAVAYLTWSKYGAKYVANNNTIFAAGMNKDDKTNYEDFEDEIYTTPKYIGATTTGNPFGLYDMVGGVSNMVSAMTYERLVTQSTREVTVYPFIRRENRIPGDGIYEVSKEDTSSGAVVWRTWGGYQAEYPSASMIFLRGGDRENISGKNGIFSYNYMPFSVQNSIYNNVGFRPGLVVNN